PLTNGEVPAYVDRLRRYLNGKFGEQNLYRRTWMLVASGRLNGLLTRDQRESLVAELRAKQNSDGGWSLYKLGPWRVPQPGAPFIPPGKPDVALLEKSDGYATGLVAYALRGSGFPDTAETLKKAIEWLKTNQAEIEIDQRTRKCWRAHSLNHDRDHGGGRG